MKSSSWLWPAVFFFCSASATTLQARGQRTSSMERISKQRQTDVLEEKSNDVEYVAGNHCPFRGDAPSQATRHSLRSRSRTINGQDPSNYKHSGRRHTPIRQFSTSAKGASGRSFEAEYSAEAGTSEKFSPGVLLSLNDETSKNKISHMNILRRRLLETEKKDEAPVQNRIPPELSVSQVWVQDSPQDYIQNESSFEKYYSRAKETVSKLWMPLMQAKGWLQARYLHISEEVSIELLLLEDEYQQTDRLRRTLESDDCVQMLIRTTNSGALRR